MALISAIENWKIEALELLLSYPKVDVNLDLDFHGTPLSFAVREDCPPAVKLLLTRPDIDVNALEKFTDKTMLMWACMNNSHYSLAVLLEDERLEMNAKDQQGMTALMHAAVDGDYRSIELLLKRPDVDINLQSDDGTTALMFAFATKNVECAELLLKQPDINLDIKDIDGQTAEVIADYMDIQQAPGMIAYARNRVA